ncbi:hypothetical protein SAMN05518863_103187 [Candidatus Pantoea symbiotica]|uniref:Uncharacterized protein n=1 Tax=Candidatus Pantoea symbiotica TaxID=1884370 RepID=A0A1I3V100_9GAMM|nr:MULTISPECIES: hypothetical protein [Pantoea]SFJ87831.1 hypothetical protein SAMN05518863_103187 [Pantoea symbiotica]SFU61729.1 hypothetical protein SAMN05518864_103187 [Pantoea sp. YR525]
MKCLNVVLISTALLFASSVTANETDATVLKSKLKPWQPSEITVSGEQITVVTPSADINSEIYSAIISGGVCTPIWTKDVPSSYLKDIKQINVTNKFKTIGFSFENPLNVCKEMGNLMEKPAAALMLGNTHTYNGK